MSFDKVLILYFFLGTFSHSVFPSVTFKGVVIQHNRTAHPETRVYACGSGGFCRAMLNAGATKVENGGRQVEVCSKKKSCQSSMVAYALDCGACEADVKYVGITAGRLSD